MDVKKPKVLFVCTANSARSQMAEALLRTHGGEHFEIHSAGLDPSEINPYSIKVMEELNYDMSMHTAKSVRDYLGYSTFAYVITVCSRAEDRCPSTFPGQPVRLHWPFEDPAAFEGSDEEITAFFRKIRDEIDMKVESWLGDVALETA